VDEMEEALDYISEKIYFGEEKDKQMQGISELLQTFSNLLFYDERLRLLLLPEELLADYFYEIDKKLAKETKEPDENRVYEVLDEVAEEQLKEYVDTKRTSELCTKIMQVLRLGEYNKEERAALIFAIITCLLEPGVNSVWDQISRVSIALVLEISEEEKNEVLPDLSWLIVKAFVPDREVMYICGFGCTGFLREQPDGLLSLTIFRINALEGGLNSVYIKNDLDLEALDNLLEKLKHDLPPWQEGTPEQASLCIWGLDSLFNKDKKDKEWQIPLESYLASVPKPKGEPREWQAALIAPGGFISSDLLQFLKGRDISEVIPEGKEIVTLTTVTYSIWDPDKIVEILVGREPEFSVEFNREAKEWQFSCMCVYTEGDDSSLAKLGARKVLAVGTIGKDTLVVEGMTLSMTGRACYYLRELVGEFLTFKGVKWVDPLEHFRKEEKKRTEKGKR